MTRSKAGLLALMAIFIGTLIGPGKGIAQEAGERDTVTVEARREVDVEPDLGTVSFGVRATGDTAEAATDRLAARARRVIDALEGAGFTDDEIDTVNINLDRRCIRFCFNRNDDTPDRIFGYVGSAGVRLETAQLDRIGEVIDIGVAAGASSIRNVSFDVSDKTAAVNEALRQAMLVAQDKARTLAETGGRTLGRAIVIVEGNSFPPRAFTVSPDAAFAAGRISGSGGGTDPFPIEPPTLSASARVQVTFELL